METTMTEQPATKPKTKKQLPAVRPSAAVAERSARGLISALIEAAGDPACDAAKARTLFELWKDVKAQEAIEAFTRDFIALQKELPSIRTDGKIEIREKDAQTKQRTGRVQQATPYATFQNIMRVIKPKLIAHNFALSFSTEPELQGGRLIVRGFLEHGGGHSRSTAFPLPIEDSGSKNNVQGWGSSMSYGKRYATIALLNIVSHARQDQDTDGHEGDFKPKAGGGLVDVTEVPFVSGAQVEQLREVIESTGVGLNRFLTKYQIKRIHDLPANLYDAAVAACKTHQAQRDARG